MFYSDVILAKRGPLARVWLAAHWERKLSKSNYLQANIEKSVTAIMGQEVVPMALRLSGQLLLGVVRIYSRKAKYLLDDCNEALLKIKVAFRSGAVDLTSDQLTVSGAAITLPESRTDFNLLLPDPMLENWDTDQFRTPSKAKKPRNPGSLNGPGSSHTAKESDITLARQDFDSFYDDGFDVASIHDGINSQDFDPDGSGGLDLGLDFDDLEGNHNNELEKGEGNNSRRIRRNDNGELVDENGDLIPEGQEIDDSFDVGVGRDAIANTSRQSLGSLLKDNDGDVTMGDGGENDGPPGDDGFDFFDGGNNEMPNIDDMPDFNGSELDARNLGRLLARSVTPLDDPLSDVTPRTQNQIKMAADKRERDLAARGLKGKKMVIDNVTELAESQRGAVGRRAVDGILTTERYLCGSRAHLRLLAIRNDPISYLLPYSTGKSLDSVYAGPSDLAPELQSLFTFDFSRRRQGGSLEDERTPKRARPDDDAASEVGRREAGDQTAFGNLVGDDGFDFFDGGNNEMPNIDDMPDFGGFDQQDGLNPFGEEDGGEGEGEISGKLPALNRLATPEEQIESLLNENFTPSTNNPLAGFEVRASDSVLERSDKADSSLAEISGWSKNTVRAQRVIRSQLEKDLDESISQERLNSEMSFEKVSENSTRRAAAGFFFELLVLGTKDCITIKQEEPYDDILVKGKDSLWETTGRTPSSRVRRERREEEAAGEL